MNTIFATCIFLCFFVQTLFAAEDSAINKISPPTGGAVLEFPSGRQLLESQPLFFKWTIANENAKTATLKIFEDIKDQTQTTPLFRTDFQTEVSSLRLSQLILNEGSYYWELETFDDKNSNPVTRDRAYFEIEASQILNLKTSRIFASGAYGRGQYKSSDTNFNLSFDTTPTIFGGGYAGGSKKTLHEITYTFSDLTIRGGVRKFQAGRASFSYRILGSNPYSFEMFIGPQVRVLTFPIINSPDGTTINSKQSTSFQGGLQLSMQKQYSQQTNFFATIFADNAFDAKNYFSNLSYEVKFGTIYNLKWPLGIGIDFAYKSDEFTETVNAIDVSATSQSLIVAGKVIYSF